MEYKVEITSDVGMGMAINHIFSKVVDTDDEAEEFGEEAKSFSSKFMDGFGRE